MYDSTNMYTVLQSETQSCVFLITCDSQVAIIHRHQMYTTYAVHACVCPKNIRAIASVNAE